MRLLVFALAAQFLLFGALISATDPVAVVALFRSLGAPRALTLLVEGESLFNDGTAIVVFNLMLAIVMTNQFNPVASLTSFLVVSVGGRGWGSGKQPDSATTAVRATRPPARLRRRSDRVGAVSGMGARYLFSLCSFIERSPPEGESSLPAVPMPLPEDDAERSPVGNPLSAPQSLTVN